MKYHVQVSLKVNRWPDQMLKGLLDEGGRPCTAKRVREIIKDFKARGFAVIPCSCPGAQVAPGRCPGMKEGAS